MRGNLLLKWIDKILGPILLLLIGFFRKRHHPIGTDAPKKIVVIKLSAIGDTLLLAPALDAIRAKYPEAEILFIGTSINQSVIAREPTINHAIIINMKELLFKPLTTIHRLSQLRPDLTLDFDQWTRVSALIGAATLPRYFIGFKTEGQSRHYAYDRAIPHEREQHEIDCFLQLTRSIGCEAKQRPLRFTVYEQEQTTIDALLKAWGVHENHYVILHPETPAHGTQRSWPIPYYIELGNRISSQYGLPILITGTERERESHQALADKVEGQCFCAPAMTLGELAALYQKARYVICGNTGIMHLACAVNAPLIALHGPTDSKKWGPVSERSVAIQSPLTCSPCLYLGFDYKCATNACMRMITPEVVLHAMNLSHE